MGKVRILNQDGDQLLVEGNVDADVGGRRITKAEARKLVTDHVAKGGLAYKVDGPEREQIREYDPRTQETVLAPRLVGG